MLTCGTLEVGCGLGYTQKTGLCVLSGKMLSSYVYSYFEQVVKQISPELMFKLRWS